MSKNNDTTTFWQLIKSYFNAFPDKEHENDIIKDITAGITFRGANLWVLICAIFIASLGLNINSTAVVIGAMLISPLMGPIVGMGLAVGINDLALLKRSAKNYLIATIISVLTALFYFLLTPLNEAQSELLARTSPTLYDVFIALCGGAAGILAICSRSKGNVIPGVAIATALMPPLCTAGYGLATGNPSYFLGAFYLYFINTVFICVATFIGVRMFKFRPKTFEFKKQQKRIHRYIWGLVLVTMIPAAFMTVNIVKDTVKKNNVSRFVRHILNSKNTHIISQTVDEHKKTIELIAVGKILSSSDIEKAKLKLPDYKLTGYNLTIVQGSETDSLLLSKKINDITHINEEQGLDYLRKNQEVKDLGNLLNEYKKYDKITIDIAKEVKSLFPQIKSIAISQMIEARTDTTLASKHEFAIIDLKKADKFSSQDQTKLEKWLQTRVNNDSLRLIIKNN